MNGKIESQYVIGLIEGVVLFTIKLISLTNLYK
jgi:hypothetical protein